MLLTTILADDCQEWQEQTPKEVLLNCWISGSYFSGYHADFHKKTMALSEHGRDDAWSLDGMSALALS